MKQNSNKFAVGRCLFNESQAIDKIKMYASQIFTQTEAQSELSFAISQSESSENKYAKYIGKHNLPDHTTRKYTKQLLKYCNKEEDEVTWGQQYNLKSHSRTYSVIPEEQNTNPKRLRQTQKDEQTMRIIKKQFVTAKKVAPNINNYSQSNLNNKNTAKAQNSIKRVAQINQQRFITWKRLPRNNVYSTAKSSIPNWSSQKKFYKSPYSKQLYKQTIGQNYKSKIEVDHEYSEAKKMKRKLFEINAQHQKIQQQVANIKRQNTKMTRFSTKNTNPRYMQAQKIMDGYAGYISKNIYGRVKTEHSYSQADRYLRKKPSYDKTMSKQKRQKLWDSFIQKNKDWESNKKNRLIQMQMEKQRDQKKDQKLQLYNTKDTAQPTVQEYLKRINRKKLNLKQKLLGIQYKPTIFVHQRQVYRNERSKQARQKADDPVSRKLLESSLDSLKSSKQQFSNSKQQFINSKQQYLSQTNNKIRLKNPQEIQFIMNRHLQH